MQYAIVPLLLLAGAALFVLGLHSGLQLERLHVRLMWARMDAWHYQAIEQAVLDVQVAAEAGQTEDLMNLLIERIEARSAATEPPQPRPE